MGTCPYCGKGAGLFKKEHAECASRRAETSNEIFAALHEFALNGQGTASLAIASAHRAASSGQVGADQERRLLVDAWETIATVALLDDDNDPDADTVDRIDEMRRVLRIVEGDLAVDSALTQLDMRLALRAVLQGQAPPDVTAHFFNLQRGESMLWVLQNTLCFRDVAHRSYAGGYHGFSVRVARGLYYRAGAFKGRPVTQTSRDLIDVGQLGIASKHLYFAGSREAVRIPLVSVVSFEPFDDGLGVAQQGRPMQVFKTGFHSGWFLYNLVQNVGHVA